MSGREGVSDATLIKILPPFAGGKKRSKVPVGGDGRNSTSDAFDLPPFFLSSSAPRCLSVMTVQPVCPNR